VGSYYQVTRTPGGGYWVNEGDAFDGIATEGAALAGAAIGLAVFGTFRAVGKFRHDRAWAAIERAEQAQDWPLLERLAGGFVRSHPEELSGYGALAQAMLELKRPPADVVAMTNQWLSRGGSAGEISGVRALSYLDAQQMANLLREANSLVNFNNEYKVLGHMMRARALMWLGDLSEAMVNATTAVSLMPERMPYEVRGDVRWASGDLAGAIEDFGRSIRLSDDPIELLEKRASVKHAQGDDAGAEEDAHQASELIEQRRAAAEAKAAAIQAIPSGGWMPEQARPSGIACLNCGYDRTPAGKASCFNCGRPLPGTPSQDAVSVTQPQGVAEATAPQQADSTPACPNCGYTRTPTGKASCFNCGRRLPTE
jgi:tetratricopeptide (TPR) repeat protein